MTHKIIILGGHGKVALLATPKLVASGFEVESVIRTPDHEQDIKQAGATPRVVDIESASVDEMADLFKGAYAVVFSAGAGGGNPQRTRAVDYEAATRSMAAAEQAGVDRYIMVSYATALVDIDRVDPESSFYPYAVAKHEADKFLRKTALNYTILGPGLLTLEPASKMLDLAGDDGTVNGANRAHSDTSRDNVAEVINHVLANNVGLRQTINFYDGETPLAEALPSEN